MMQPPHNRGRPLPQQASRPSPRGDSLLLQGRGDNAGPGHENLTSECRRQHQASRLARSDSDGDAGKDGRQAAARSRHVPGAVRFWLGFAQGVWGKTCTDTYAVFFHLGGPEGWLAGLEGGLQRTRVSNSLSLFFSPFLFLFFSFLFSFPTFLFSFPTCRGKEKRKEKRRERKRKKERGKEKKETGKEKKTRLKVARSSSNPRFAVEKSLASPQKLFALQSQGSVIALSHCFIFP